MKNFEGYLKRKLGDSYVLLAGGGHKDLNELLNLLNYYGLENLAVSVVGQGRCTTTDSGLSITTSGIDADTYFTINTSEPIKPDQEYTLGFYVENWPSGVSDYWGWPPGQQSNGSNWLINITGNGWFWGTGKFPSADGNTSSLFLDDNAYSGNIRSYLLKFSKFTLVKGNMKAFWSPAISNMRVAYATTAGSASANDVYAWAKASTKPSYTYSEVGAASSTHTHDGVYLDYGGDITTLGAGSPFSTVKTWVTSTNLPNSFKILYDSSGTEYSMLFTFRPGNLNNGSILKWGYDDAYIRMARRVNGTWQSEDWEKISAGYADSAASATNADYATSAEDSAKIGGTAAVDVFRFLGGTGETSLNTFKGSYGSYYINGVTTDVPSKCSNGQFLCYRSGDTWGQIIIPYVSDGSLVWRGATTGSNNPTWKKIWDDSNDGSGSGLDADLLDGLHGNYYAISSHNHNGIYLDYGGDVRDIGSNAPIADAKTYVSTTNLPNAFKILYDSAGYENTLLYTFRPGSITANSSGTGTILKWGAWSTYMYLARNTGNNWLTEDWEKISAGYADNAGLLNNHADTYFATATHTHLASDITGGCPLTISGGHDRKIYLKDTDGEKWSLISFLDKDGVEYGLLGVHGTNVLCWNLLTIYHSGNLPAYPTKSSWNYNDMYVTSVGVTDDATNHANQLRYVLNGNSTYFTVPYATLAGTISVTDKSTHPSSSSESYYIPMVSAKSGSGTIYGSSDFFMWRSSDSNYLNIGNSGITSGITFHRVGETSGKYGNLISAACTDIRTWTLPNASGTLALTSLIPTKSSWNYNDVYITVVGAGGTDHTNEVYYTKNGSNTYFTVPYASNSGALEGNSLNDVIKRNGSRNCVSMKPATAGGRTAISGFTIVAHPKTNLGDTYYYLKAITDIPTGKYIFSIKSSGFSGTDHWVFYFLNSGSYGYVDCKNGWSSAIINMPTAISAGSNILIDDSNSGTAANSADVVFSEWMLTPIDEGTYMPAPEDLVHLYGGQTISGNLTASSFIKSGSTSSKVLLGDGSDKDLSDFILHKEFSSNSIDDQSGSFFFGGDTYYKSGYDYVGLLAGNSSDKWQLIAIDQLKWRQNDNGGTNTSWGNWYTLLDSNNYSSYALPISGGNMTGNIGYTGSKATYTMIQFIDNTSDTYGNGIAIGGGGLTIIGGGESASAAATAIGGGGSEQMIVCNDGSIEFYSNVLNGWSSKKSFTMSTDGEMYINGNKVWHAGNHQMVNPGTASSLTSLDITKTFIYVTLSANVAASAFTLSSAMSTGQCLTVLVYNSGSATISITIPSSWKSLDGYNLTCGATKFLEISIVKYASGANDYILSSKSQ